MEGESCERRCGKNEREGRRERGTEEGLSMKGRNGRKGMENGFKREVGLRRFWRRGGIGGKEAWKKKKGIWSKRA